MRPPRWAAAPLVAAVLVSCASPDAPSDAAGGDGGTRAGSGNETTADPGPAPPPDATAADEDPDGLLAFTGRQLDGGTFDGAAVTGDVVVWFWTPW